MKIGILGGGQLARMLIEENSRYGYEFHVLSKESDSPAGQITRYETVGDWNDLPVVMGFVSDCDLITLENEFIDFHILEAIRDSGRTILPEPDAIRLIQDKLFQKRTLAEAGIPVADFCEADTEDDVKKFSEEFGYPLILKSRTMGYDGKGNAMINSDNEIAEACSNLSKRGKLMCERFIKFDKEIATQAVRSLNGEFKVYPPVETIQENHICNVVIAGNEFSPAVQRRVQEISSKILTSLNYSGVMGIEMFVTGDEILVNELAPRVHNTGHYTIEACDTSQFENHIRAIAGLPLGSTSMNVPASVMINILGRRNGRFRAEGIENIMKCKNTYIHLYGKKETKTERKMGHITLKGNDAKDLLKKAYEARNAIEV